MEKLFFSENKQLVNEFSKSKRGKFIFLTNIIRLEHAKVPFTPSFIWSQTPYHY